MKHMIAISLLLLTACASTAPTRLLESSEFSKAPDTGLLIQTELSTTEAFADSHGCKLEFQELATMGRFHVIIRPGSSNTLIKMAPGLYKISRFDCQGRTYWEMPMETTPGFKVISGKISYAGALSIKQTMIGSSTNVSTQFLTRGEAYERFRTLVLELHTTRSRLINASTAEEFSRDLISAIVAGKLDSPQSTQSFQRAKISAGAKSTDVKYAPIQSCISNEVRENLVRIGNAVFVAKFDKRRVIESGWTRKTASYSQKFLDCVKSAVDRSDPGVPDQVEFEYSFSY